MGHSPDATPTPAAHWRLRTRTLTIGRIPLFMGILNVTPDSFSDAGQFFDTRAAVDRGLALAAEGADILDVGGESTRPYSTPVSTEEELRRVLPVIEALAAQTAVPISIDTMKAEVARAALAAGAEIINDVSGLTADPAMLDLAVETGAGICVMHMQGTPQTMQDDPTYDDVAAEVSAYLRERRDAIMSAGTPQDRIALDPGIGFGKTKAHNLELLRKAARFHDLGCPILVGHSRKGFIQKVLNEPDVEPVSGTIGVALALAREHIQILRVHDVAQVRRALLLFAASGGLE